MARARWQLDQYHLPASQGMSNERRITVAIPSTIDVKTATVVYCADGQVVERLSAELERSSVTENPPILIGVHSHPTMRAEEYLLGSSEPYLAHERFFTDDLRSWAHERLGISRERENSALFGFSNGGAFAVATTLRHSDRFVAAIAFSVPAFGRIPLIPQSPDLRPSIYLAAGNQGAEKSIRKNVLKLLKVLQRNQIVVEYCERTEDHTLDFWVREFVRALHWLEHRPK